MRKGRVFDYEKRRMRSGMAFIAPWTIGFLVFTLFPVGYCLYMALNKVDFMTDHLEMTWIGLGNFNKALFLDAEVPNKLLLTFQQSILTIPVIVVFALIMALLLNSKFPGRPFFRAVFFLPVVLTCGNLLSTLSSQGQGTMSFLQSDTAQALVKSVGGTLGESLKTITDNFLVILWYSGVQMLLLIAGMQSINPSTFEAARIDGAGKWEVLWTITLPGIAPFIFVATIYTIVDQFTMAYNPMLELISWHSQNPPTGYGYASAIAWLYFAVILSLIGAALLLFRKSLGMAGHSRRK